MCTQPLWIRNRRTKSLSVNTPYSFIKVPCGVCDECLRARAQSLFARAFSEYEYCKNHGGDGFMCTLTYSNPNLPYLYYEGNKYMVFNKQHVIDFIKRLRINLDRYCKKHNYQIVPFKYLVTSEYGTDPTRTHRPHYHLLFFFPAPISPNVFRKCFVQSMSIDGKNVFGQIYQCSLIDPKKGGIKYSAKYVCKDLMFEHQRKLITGLIKFWREYVYTQFNIHSLPDTIEKEFHNKCIRTNKDYKKAIHDYVLKYRHMLQFYMLSNDLGSSALIEKYGESLWTMTYLNINGYPFSIPKNVKDKLSKKYGYEKSNQLSKQIFTKYLSKCLSTLELEKKISSKESLDLQIFAQNYVMFFGGNLYLYNPEGIDFFASYFQNKIIDWDTILDEFRFFQDNDFFTIRDRLLEVLGMYNTTERNLKRASVAHRKSEEEKQKYETKKRNNSYRY